MQLKTLTVSQLNSYIKKILDNDFILKNSCIKGEISNFKVHSSGHIYFSLKDEQSKINCIMFKAFAEELTFVPENGDSVVVVGRVSVYQKDGSYQFYCESIEKQGIGNLFIAFENLKNKLLKERIFDEEHKKEIPKYARKIGVVTSPTGAAIKDIINVARRRNSKIEILIYPSLVQGKDALEQLIKGIKYLESREDVDVIILARGGGSIEELWSFNDEKLAYEIYKCSKPIISGIGHETDFTIADFVSDKRASTPSAASEIAVFNLEELQDRIKEKQFKLYKHIKHQIRIENINIQMALQKIGNNNPMNLIANEYSRIDNIKERFKYIISRNIDKEKERIKKMNSLLCAHNPLNVLNKGYAIVQDEDSNIITDIGQIRLNECIKITLKSGEIKLLVNKFK